MADGNRLVAQRGDSRAVATRLITRITQIHADAAIDRPRKIHDLKQKLVELHLLLVKIEDLDDKVIDETDDADVVAEQDAIDNVMFQIGVLEREEANAVAAAVPLVPATVPVPATVVNNRATSWPKMNLPRFNGDILKWQSFWKTFDAEIHSDANTPNISKFNYLMGQLEPKVANVVANLAATNDNYPVLVKLLQDCYGSEAKIIAAHMRTLQSLEAGWFSATSQQFLRFLRSKNSRTGSAR